jgi:16S rRNA processing protein RimM
LSDAASEFDPNTAVTVGRVVSAHGIRGELKVESLTDFPERFRAGSRLWLEGVPRIIERSRQQGKMLIIKLDAIDSRTHAEALRGKQLMVPEAQAIEDESVYYLHDIVGLQVVEDSGEALGEVVDVLATGSNDVYVVRGRRGEVLLPALDDVIKEVDLSARRMLVALPEGLDFQGPAKNVRGRPQRRASNLDIKRKA